MRQEDGELCQVPSGDSMEALRTPLEDLVPFREANWGSFHVSLRECIVV